VKSGGAAVGGGWLAIYSQISQAPGIYFFQKEIFFKNWKKLIFERK